MAIGIAPRRGTLTGLASATTLNVNELLVTTDRNTSHLATSASTAVPLVTPIDLLTPLLSADVVSANDKVMVHSASALGVKEKSMTIDEFKLSLNLPSGSTDEKTAAVTGGASGSLFGTNGTDGVLRLGTGLKATVATDNSYATVDLDFIDCGTF